jgi:hypothetical protein
MPPARVYRAGPRGQPARVHGFLISGVGSSPSDPGTMMPSIGMISGGPATIRSSPSTCFARLASTRVLPLRPQTPRARTAYGQRAAAHSAALYEFLISAVEKAIIRQSRVPPDPAPAVYAGWARRKRPKCGTVNAIRPRSEL